MNDEQTTTMPTMPAFVFQRRRDIELETGLTLAGKLIVDIPKGTEMDANQEQMIGGIVQQLTEEAQSGRMPDNAFIIGWRGGRRPPDADNITNEQKAAWSARSVGIAVRVDPRKNTDVMQIDSDIAKQLGLIREH
jgi:hypothetical protein